MACCEYLIVRFLKDICLPGTLSCYMISLPTKRKTRLLSHYLKKRICQMWPMLFSTGDYVPKNAATYNTCQCINFNFCQDQFGH